MGFYSAREKSGLTQAEVARVFSIDQSAVSQWETGKTAPRVSLLPKLAKLYGCTVDELLSSDNKKET